MTITGSKTLFPGAFAQWSVAASLSDNTTTNVTADVTWESSDQAVVRVSSTAVVTAVAVGQATVRASYLGLSTTATVTVEPDVPFTVSLRGPIALVAGIPVHWSVIAGSRAAERDVTNDAILQSSDESIVRVSAGGVVTGMAPGQATLRATYLSLSSSAMAVLVGVQAVPVKITYTFGRELTSPAGFSVRLGIDHGASVGECTAVPPLSSGGTTSYTCALTLVGAGSYVVTSGNFLPPCITGYTVTSTDGTPVLLTHGFVELRSTTDMCFTPFTLDAAGKVGG